MKVEQFLSFEDTQVAFAALSDAELWRSYLLFKAINNQQLSKLGTQITRWAYHWRLPISPIVRNTIYRQFCGGETLSHIIPTINKLDQYNVKSMLDYGVEAKDREKDFDQTAKKLLKSILFAEKHLQQIPVINIKISGFAKFALLEAIQQQQQLNPTQQEALRRVEHRIDTLCQAAHDAQIALYFDAEESWIQDALDTFVNAMMKKYNQQKPIVHNTYQIYRHDRLDVLKAAHQQALEHGYLLGAKVVRGAYMEKERERAQKLNYPSPIQPDKAATDRDFDAALYYCLHNIDTISFCCASHNEQSTLTLCQMMHEKNIPRNHPHIWFGQLYGMSNHISYNLAAAGYNAAKYLPYGPVTDVIPYLIRRAQENTSVAGQAGRELQLVESEIKRRKQHKWWKFLPL